MRGETEAVGLFPWHQVLFLQNGGFNETLPSEGAGSRRINIVQMFHVSRGNLHLLCLGVTITYNQMLRTPYRCFQTGLHV